ncbi:50S ribosomal protein L18 [Candidatus Adlerbacteria bacterium RIFCSPHIGHO2_02_FULL_54_18]|uniref:Large ribosomal subunit protein uL18 n=2 Tax=Candidatus Adleribacteriota TaxID=1752736 RepID=A0A1F4Y222_9BACT|nr:MAG: 50S ribosomal protein L18 [Candidatus Adlerbacteria bacterium RIFCSPLOWO2_01_FULL_54_21b]OGC87888.1 MAG: 50S ribosomal protein L18 [Candidatus Adlerbacteria bacterium RIFCSPHIGHO2_02_FULL_54_18]
MTQDTNLKRRHKRIRAKVIGTQARPRLAVYKSNRYLHAQIINDDEGRTLIAGSTKEMGKDKKMSASEKLGAELAKRATAAGIAAVVFDRGGFRYTGRVAKLAEAARKGGLQF